MLLDSRTFEESHPIAQIHPRSLPVNPPSGIQLGNTICLQFHLIIYIRHHDLAVLIHNTRHTIPIANHPISISLIQVQTLSLMRHHSNQLSPCIRRNRILLVANRVSHIIQSIRIIVQHTFASHPSIKHGLPVSVI